MSAESADRPPILRLDGVRKSYGDTAALGGVSMRLDGGVVGLLGANGAGKTTLYRAVLNLLPIDGGTIEVAGLDARRQAVEARRRIGYLPEELRLYERLSGSEYLHLVAALKGLGDAAEESRELTGYLGLGDRRDLLIGEYSLGMRKKIGIAAALLGAPPLVLLDEPLNGLDTESMRRLRLRIEEMAAAGTTFVLSSHVMSFVERICGRVVILRRGVVVADAAPEELRRELDMEEETFEDVFLHLAL